MMDGIPSQELVLELIAAGCEPVTIQSADLRAEPELHIVFRRRKPTDR